MKKILFLKNQWETIIEKMKRKEGCYSHPMEISQAATEEEILAVENKLNINLPTSYRNVLKHFSKSLHWRVSFPDNIVMPKKFDEIFACEIGWNIEDLEDLTEWANEWFEEDSEDYGVNLRGKLGFGHSGNGDVYAFDMDFEGDDKPVIYWDHETGEITYLAENFIVFLDKITNLGCIGNEIWQFEYFLDEKGLNTDSPLSIEWKNWLNSYLVI